MCCVVCLGEKSFKSRQPESVSMRTTARAFVHFRGSILKASSRYFGMVHSTLHSVHSSSIFISSLQYTGVTIMAIIKPLLWSPHQASHINTPVSSNSHFDPPPTARFPTRTIATKSCSQYMQHRYLRHLPVTLLVKQEQYSSLVGVWSPRSWKKLPAMQTMRGRRAATLGWTTLLATRVLCLRQ